MKSVTGGHPKPELYLSSFMLFSFIGIQPTQLMRLIRKATSPHMAYELHVIRVAD